MLAGPASRTGVLLAALALSACQGSVTPGELGPSVRGAAPPPGASDTGPKTIDDDPGQDPGNDHDRPLQCDAAHFGLRTSLRRLTPAQYEAAVEDLFAGLVRPSPRFPPLTGDAVSGFSTELASNFVDELWVEETMEAAIEAALQLAPRMDTLFPCLGRSDADCARAFIEEYGGRAYRRPLSSEEITELQAVYDLARRDEDSRQEAMATVAASILQAPQFLYVLESGQLEGARRRLDGFEVASRLSFLIWDSIPDQTLLDEASAGRLSAAEQIESQALRMFDDPKANRGLIRFFREWLHLDEVTAGAKSTSLFPGFSAQVAEAMNQSFDQTILHMVRTGATLHELMTTSSFVMDERLAGYLDEPSASRNGDLVQLPQERFTGILSHPLASSSFSSSESASYVQRGRVVVEELMCTILGDIPENAVEEADKLGLPPDATGKMKSAAVRSNPACAFCHNLMDPPGLAFEVFDATGRYRSEDRHGNLIDPSGQTIYGSDGVLSFAGVSDLMSGLSQNTRMGECFEREWYRFATSRMDGADDACDLQSIRQQLPSGATLKDAMMALVTSESFLYRRAE